MTAWFVQQHTARIRGPMTSKELLSSIHAGEVIGETLIRKDDSQWVRADQVNGLWQAAEKPTIHFRCPDCKTLIAKPPTACSGCGRRVQTCIRETVEHLVDQNQSKSRPRSFVSERKLVNSEFASGHKNVNNETSDVDARREETHKVKQWVNQLLRKRKRS